MPEISACEWDKLRMDSEIARRVHAAEGHLPRPRPQAAERFKQGVYQPPGPGKRKPGFHRQSRLTPAVPVDSPEVLKRQPPGPEGRQAGAGAVEAGIELEPQCNRCGLLQTWCRCGKTPIIELVRRLMNENPAATIEELCAALQPEFSRFNQGWLKNRVGTYRNRILRGEA